MIAGPLQQMFLRHRTLNEKTKTYTIPKHVGCSKKRKMEERNGKAGRITTRENSVGKEKGKPHPTSTEPTEFFFEPKKPFATEASTTVSQDKKTVYPSDILPGENSTSKLFVYETSYIHIGISWD